MTDRLTEWHHRLTHTGPLSYPDQQALLREATTLKERMTNWQTCSEELEAERKHLRAGLDAAADYLAADPVDAGNPTDANTHRMMETDRINDAGRLFVCEGVRCSWGWRSHSAKDASERWSVAHHE